MDWEIHQHPNDFFRFTRYGLSYLFERAGLRVSASRLWAVSSGCSPSGS